MKLRTLTVSGCLAVVLGMWPALSQAAPKAVSSDSLAAARTLETLKDLHEIALDAADCADQLEAANRTFNTSWEVYSRLLDNLKEDLNRMGRTLRQTATSEFSTTNQKVALARAMNALNAMADNTQSAMTFMQEVRVNLWSPTYQKYLTNIAAQSSELVSSIARAAQPASK